MAEEVEEKSETLEILETVIKNQKYLNNEISDLKKLIKKEIKDLRNFIDIKLT